MDEVKEDEDVKVEENEIKVEMLEEEHEETRMCNVYVQQFASLSGLSKSIKR